MAWRRHGVKIKTAKKHGKSRSNGKKIAAGVVVTAVIVGLLCLMAGMAIAPNHDTRVRISVDIDYGIITNGHLNSSINCTEVLLDVMTFSWNAYNAIDGFFAANSVWLTGYNTLVIHSMNWTDYTLACTFNGAPVTLIEYGFGP
jgi:hypothetical protein